MEKGSILCTHTHVHAHVHTHLHIYTHVHAYIHTYTINVVNLKRRKNAENFKIVKIQLPRQYMHYAQAQKLQGLLGMERNNIKIHDTNKMKLGQCTKVTSEKQEVT